MNSQTAFLLSKSLESIRVGKLDTAELYLRQAIKFEPSNPHTLRLLGVIAIKNKSFSKALEYLNKSLKTFPNNPLTLSNLGILFYELGDYMNALAAYEKSIKIDPKYDEAWSNKGNVLLELKRYTEAIAHHDQAISINPKYAEAWSNKGNVLLELKRYTEAIAHHDQAISINPKYAEAWSNKGNVLHKLGYHSEAITHFNTALSLNPNYHEASWNKSLTLLLLGDFENGLPLYESRWNSSGVGKTAGRRIFNRPTWFGEESIRDKTILIYAEQGLGDIIQFCRYVKLLANLGAKVILEVPQALFIMLKNLDGVAQTIIQGDELPNFDYQCPILSLPLALKTNLSSIPGTSPYLKASQDKVEEWAQRLGKKTKKRVGLTWSSVSGFRGDSDRSLSLEEFIQALPPEDFEYICLQKELKECDKVFFEDYQKIKFMGDKLIDFSDTAALIENLDLVVSTCTSIPHLSGALGKETWVLLAHVPDWRWLLDRRDTPWYPNTRLFRQPSMGDWSSVFKQVRSELSAMKVV